MIKIKYMKSLKITAISMLTAALTLSSCGEDYITVDPTDVATGEQIDDLATKNPDKLMIVIDPLFWYVQLYESI